jgi:cold shock CspA family protein
MAGEAWRGGLVLGILTGRVVAFDEARGLGEVEADDGRRFPFHCTRIADGSRRIEVGTPVCFLVRAGLPGRWEADRLVPRA